MTDAERRVRVIAHRGASRDRPENTRAAFEEALVQGADGIELDVQLSRDGIPVVYHDRTLVRAGGGRRRVARLDFDELARLDAGSRSEPRFRREPILALEQVLESYGRRTRLLVEIKTREGRGAGARHELLARTVARLVGRMRLQSRVLLLAFDPVVLAACADELPDARTVLNLKPPRRMTKAVRARMASLHALSTDVRSLTPAFAEAVHEAGRELYVYTCNRPGSVRRAVAARPAGIMSDRPAWLAETLRGETAKHAT